MWFAFHHSTRFEVVKTDKKKKINITLDESQDTENDTLQIAVPNHRTMSNVTGNFT